jgi:hypothetical protein
MRAWSAWTTASVCQGTNYRKLHKLQLHLRSGTALETFNACFKRVALLRQFERKSRLLAQQRC